MKRFVVTLSFLVISFHAMNARANELGDLIPKTTLLEKLESPVDISKAVGLGEFYCDLEIQYRDGYNTGTVIHVIARDRVDALAACLNKAEVMKYRDNNGTRFVLKETDSQSKGKSEFRPGTIVGIAIRKGNND